MLEKPHIRMWFFQRWRNIMLKQKAIFANLGYMINVMWGFSKQLFFGKLLISVLNGVSAPINAYIVKVLIEYITQSNWKASLLTVGVMTAVNLTIGFSISLINKKLGITSDLFRNYLMFEFYSKIANMDYEILYTPEMMQNKDMALQAIQGGRATNYLDIMFSCFSSFVSLFSVICLLSSFTWWVYPVILFLCAIRVITVAMDQKRKFHTSLSMATLNTEISYYMSMLTDEAYVNDVRMFSISDWIVYNYKRCISKAHILLKNLLQQVCKSNLIRSVLSNMETLFIYIYTAVQMIFYSMSFADFSLVTTTLRTLSDSVTNITKSILDIGENSAYIQIYRQFMGVANRIAIPGEGINVEKICKSKYIFELKNVCFSYPGSKNMVLNHINLQIEQGNFYVVVGKNGAGKTTLVRLLCRLYDVTSGTLLYMNTDVKDIEYKSYRDNIGVVFQDYQYYCMSIAENVAMNEYSDTVETQNRILEALKKAGLYEKISSLPKGIYTQLGKIFDKEGILLSGGELQKLALARTIFKNPSIVILDEPSSALDAFAENELISTFNFALQGKTVIYISHRLSVAKYADKVMYINNGMIEEFDTHENLMRKSASYKELYDVQAKHYR